MTKQHPIIPPPELVREWQREANHNEAMFPQVAAMSAQWGADQELEACIREVSKPDRFTADDYLRATQLADRLRTARRPKPPSLKEQALEVLDDVEFDFCTGKRTDIIRRALEQLPDD